MAMMEGAVVWLVQGQGQGQRESLLLGRLRSWILCLLPHRTHPLRRSQGLRSPGMSMAKRYG